MSSPMSSLWRGFAVSALAAFALASMACKSDPPGDVAPSSSEMARKIAGIEPGTELEVDPGVFMLMHRVGAGEPLGEGWHRAASTEGGFSVEVPLAFNDFRVRSQAKDGVEVRSHTVGGKTPGKLAWTATCIARRDGSYGPGNGPPPPDRVEPKGSPPSAYQRTVALEGRLCALIVEAQGSDPLPDEATRARFLQSLRATGTPTW